MTSVILEIWDVLEGSLSIEVLRLIAICSLGAIYVCVKDSFREPKHQGLFTAMGFKSGSYPSRVIIKEKSVKFYNIPAIAMTDSFWLSKIDILSNYFNQSIIDIRISGHNSSKKMAEAIFDCLPISFKFDLRSINLNPMEIFLGVNQYGDNVKVSLMENASIYIDGRPGSGKSVALKSIINSYLVSFRQDKDSEPVEIIIITTKVADFNYLKKRKDIKLTLIDIFDSDSTLMNQCETIVNSLSELKESQNEFNEIVERLGLSDAGNIEQLRQKGIAIRAPRRIYIFDEAKDYLSKEKGDSKEETEAKQKLIKSIGIHLRRNARFLSTPIIVAAQVQNENDLDIPLKSFHLRLCSNTNESMSRILSGSNLLTDPSFTKGKFFVKTEKSQHIIRVPFD